MFQCLCVQCLILESNTVLNIVHRLWCIWEYTLCFSFSYRPSNIYNVPGSILTIAICMKMRKVIKNLSVSSPEYTCSINSRNVVYIRIPLTMDITLVTYDSMTAMDLQRIMLQHSNIHQFPVSNYLSRCIRLETPNTMPCLNFGCAAAYYRRWNFFACTQFKRTNRVLVLASVSVLLVQASISALRLNETSNVSVITARSNVVTDVCFSFRQHHICLYTHCWTTFRYLIYKCHYLSTNALLHFY